jgi:hypothetical protein
MQVSLALVGILAYAAGALEAWRLIPSGNPQRTAEFPGVFMALSLCAALFVPALRTAICRHLLTSYRTGFGQSVISVLVGLGVIVGAGGFLLWQIHAAAHGGRDPGGAFSGFGAGIGLLLAQVVLVRRLERDPSVRSEIGGP